jgi:hypothetical protein
MRQARGIPSIADHEHDLRWRTRVQGAEERLEIAAAPGDGDGYAHCHGGGN